MAALYRATFDDRLSTVTGIRHRQASARPEDALRVWRAEEDGELIGWAFAGLDSFAAVRTTASASIVVHPAHRRAGAGSALWDEASAHLDAIGARRIVAYSPERTTTPSPSSEPVASRSNRPIRRPLSTSARCRSRPIHRRA